MASKAIFMQLVRRSSTQEARHGKARGYLPQGKKQSAACAGSEGG
jgi:hypothetical protein